MHPALPYDMADVPIPPIMLSRLKALVEVTSCYFVSKHGNIAQQEIRRLLKIHENGGRDIPEQLLSYLRHWYMVDRPKMPVSKYKRRKESFSKREMLKIARTLRRYFAQYHNCSEENIVVRVMDEKCRFPDLALPPRAD